MIYRLIVVLVKSAPPSFVPSNHSVVFAMKGKTLLSLSCSVLVDFTSLGGDVELKVDDVTVEDFVVTTLLHVETFVTNLDFGATPIQILILHHLSANEAALEVCVNHSRGTWGLGTLANGPALDLVLTSSKVVGELERAVSRCHELVYHCWLAKLCSSCVSCGSLW